MKYLYSKFLSFVLRHNHGVLLSYIHPSVRELRNGTILFYHEPYRAKIFDRIRTIKQEVDFKLGYNEAYQINRVVQAVHKIKGDMAEVGVYEGGSARIILEAEKDKTLHLIDTFAGLPEVSKEDTRHFESGQYEAPLEVVQRNLSEFTNTRYHKGLFPLDTGDALKDVTFSFVNLDVDIYTSSKESLEFFYPRMAKGGVIMSHDYVSADGVRKAFDDFFADKPEPLIEMSGSQVLVVKM